MKYGDPHGGLPIKERHARATATEKVCSACDALKPLEEFPPDSRGFKNRAPQCRPCWREYCNHRNQRPDVKAKRRAFDRTPERKRRIRHAWVRRKYGERGLALELRREAGEGCDVCGSTFRTAIDHSHTTGEARGLLCMLCNTVLGKVGDSPERLLRLAKYLG